MDTTKLKFPILRVTMLCYFVYKMVFANPNFIWSLLLKLDNSSAGTIAGEIFVKVFLLMYLLPISFIKLDK